MAGNAVKAKALRPIPRDAQARPAHGASPRPASPSQTERRLFSVPETAVYLGISVWTVRELMWRGELPYVRIGQRRVLCDHRDLEAFIEARKVRDTLR